MAGGVSVEARSKRNETERPQFGEYNRALSVKSDGNDIEVPDDEHMEDGDAGFDDGSAQARNIRDPATDCPRKPTAHDPASTIQIMVQVLCGVNSPHRRSGA